MNLSMVLATFGMLILHISAAMFPVIVDCCTEVAHNIPRRRLRTVEKFKIQKGEVCKIPAVILYTKHKKLCVSLQNKHVKRWIKQKDNGHRRTSRHFRKRKKAQRGRKIGRKQ